MKIRDLSAFGRLLVILLATSWASSAGTAPLAVGTGGAVASASELATAAGLRILDEGGNAVDAAVATAAALGVTDPFSCGIGGGGFMLVYVAAERRIAAIDHRETAPAAFPSDAFLDHGVEIPFDDAVRSGLSVGVPGTVRGWELALERFGTRSLAQVLAPAIDIAERGFTVRPQFSRFIDSTSGGAKEEPLASKPWQAWQEEWKRR